jgi:hypothetical protein
MDWMVFLVVVKGCLEIFVHLLKFIFNLSLSVQTFPVAWKEMAIIPVLKKTIRPPLVTSYLLPFLMIFQQYSSF